MSLSRDRLTSPGVRVAGSERMMSNATSFSAGDIRIPEDIAELIASADAYAEQTALHAAFRRLRAENPLGRVELPDFDPFWTVTKHVDILEISRRNDLFQNGDRSTTLIAKAADLKVRTLTGGSPHLIRTVVHMDPPDHPKYRRITQAWFMPQKLRTLEQRIRSLAREFVDRLAASGGEAHVKQLFDVFADLLKRISHGSPTRVATRHPTTWRP